MDLRGEHKLAGVVRKALAESGYKAAMRTQLDNMLGRSKQSPASPYALAIRYADLGETNQALI